MIGFDGEDIESPATVVSVRDLGEFLATRSTDHARAFGDLTRLLAAIDLVMADLDTPIAGASEIAFFPPVTGG